MLDEQFQDMTLACLQRVPEFCSVACQHIEPDMFDGKIRKLVAGILIDFWTRYDSVVTDAAVVQVIKDMSEKQKMSKEEIGPLSKYLGQLKTVKTSDYKFVLERLIAFVKQQRIKLLIERAVTRHLPKEDFESIERGMAEISSISSLNKIAGYDVFDAARIAERTTTRKEESLIKRVGVTTGIDKLNDALYRGGWSPKELYLILGPPKRGKSMSLLYFSNAAAHDGVNVAHFTCEMSKEICCDRWDSMNANIDFKQLGIRHDQVAGRLTAKRPTGKIMVFEYPTKTLTVAEVRRQVERLQLEQGINIGLVVVDYLDLMRPVQRREDAWAEQGELAEELRGAASMLHVPVLSASQINRAGSSKQLSSGRDVAGGFDKIAVADQIITLNGTEQELEEGRLRLHLAESRNNPSLTITIATAFNYGRFFKEYIGLAA